MCKDYSDALAEDPSVFNRLVYVQRNWESDRKVGKRDKEELDELVSSPHGMKHYLPCHRDVHLVVWVHWVFVISWSVYKILFSVFNSWLKI